MHILEKIGGMWDSTLHFCSHLLSSQLLHISFSILMFSKTSLNIKLSLQLVPLALPPHQVSNSSKQSLICSIWFPPPSFFLQIVYCNVPNLLPVFSFNIVQSFHSFITWPSWSLSPISTEDSLLFSRLLPEAFSHPFNKMSDCFHASYSLCAQLFCCPLQTQGHPWHLLHLLCTPPPLPLLLLWCCVNMSGRDPRVRLNSSAIN